MGIALRRVYPPGYPFFACRNCFTEVALDRYYIINELSKLVFSSAFNLGIDRPEQHFESRSDGGVITLAKVTCITCDTHLGWKYVRVEGNPGFHFIQEGRYLFKTSRLIYWNTAEIQDVLTRRAIQVVDPATGEAISHLEVFHDRLRQDSSFFPL